MGKPNFSDGLKRDAVVPITERGYPVADVSQRLGVSPHSLYAWKKQFATVAPDDANKDVEISQLKRELARVTEERDILKSHRVFRQGCQSEIRLCRGASEPVWRPPDVPVPGDPAQRFRRLAQSAAEPASARRCSADCIDPAGLERQRQGLWVSQVARRSARSGRDLLSQSRCPPDQPDRHQGADRLQATSRQFRRKAFGRCCQHVGSPVRRVAC